MPEKAITEGKTESRDNIIYVGNKKFTNYAMALFTQIARKDCKEIKVVARGRFITRAIDVVEMAKRRFSEGENKIKEVMIETGSESFEKKENGDKKKKITVSGIEITIIKE